MKCKQIDLHSITIMQQQYTTTKKYTMCEIYRILLIKQNYVQFVTMSYYRYYIIQMRIQFHFSELINSSRNINFLKNERTITWRLKLSKWASLYQWFLLYKYQGFFQGGGGQQSTKHTEDAQYLGETIKVGVFVPVDSIL